MPPHQIIPEVLLKRRYRRANLLRRNLDTIRAGAPIAKATLLRICRLEAVDKAYVLYWETRRCGKPGCTKCPHGPYLYARRSGQAGKVYLGR